MVWHKQAIDIAPAYVGSMEFEGGFVMIIILCDESPGINSDTNGRAF